MKVSDLEGPALEYWFMKATGQLMMSFLPEKHAPEHLCYGGMPSVLGWAQIGPMIELERVSVTWVNESHGCWKAQKLSMDRKVIVSQYSDSAITAIMRCVVASKFGENVGEKEAA